MKATDQQLLYGTIIILLSASQVLSCFPGSEYIVDQFRSQLGIAPITDGTNFTGSTDQFIENPSLLNCDFESIGNCRWRNMPETANPTIDTEQYWMFEKTGSVSAGFMALGPLGRQPAMDSKVLVSGGQGEAQYPDGKAAIWLSDPIRCMMNPAQLDFTYWIYGQSKVRVMLLDQTTHRQFWTSPADACKALPAAWEPGADGVCRTQIPATDRPFKIGIQGYNFQTSFYVLDDIRFSTSNFGSLCDGSFEFGTTESIYARETTGEPVREASDLNCIDPGFAGCNWENDLDAPDFSTHTGTVDPTKWQTATGHAQTPNGEFLMVVKGNNAGPAVLNSEVISCQQGAGRLSFSAWMSPNVRMRACVLNPSTNVAISCQDVQRFLGPNYVLTIPGDFDDGRKLQLIAENFGDGGMAAVDDIRYEAKMCDEYGVIGGANTQKIPYEGAPIGKIQSNADFACSVDTPTSCQWGNPDTTQQWYWIRDPDPAKLQALTGSNISPVGGAAMYEFNATDNQVTFFGSDELHCIKTDGEMTFRAWAHRDVQLEVCAVIYSQQRESCKPVVHMNSIGQPGPIRVPFTTADLGSEPVVFIITAYSPTPGFVMIDDIAFTGEVCPDPNLVSPDEELCQKMSSTFSGSGADAAFGNSWFNCQTGCTSNHVFGIEQWRTVSTRLGRFNTQVRGPIDSDKPSLGVTLPVQPNFAGQDVGKMIAILQSQDFTFATPRLFSFSYQRGTWGSQIYVCKDRVPDLIRRDIPFGDPKCTRIAGPSLTAQEYLYGAQANVVVQPGDQRLYIVAIAPWKYWYGTAHFMIDDLQFHEGTDPSSAPLCVPTE